MTGFYLSVAVDALSRGTDSSDLRRDAP